MKREMLPVFGYLGKLVRRMGTWGVRLQALSFWRGRGHKGRLGNPGSYRWKAWKRLAISHPRARRWLWAGRHGSDWRPFAPWHASFGVRCHLEQYSSGPMSDGSIGSATVRSVDDKTSTVHARRFGRGGQWKTGLWDGEDMHDAW